VASGKPVETLPCPRRLAGAILVDAVSADAAALLSHEFQREVVDYCQDGEKITADEIQEWVDSECALAYAVQAANWHTPDMQQPPLPAQLPFHTPKILPSQKGSKREGINCASKSKSQNENIVKIYAALLLGAVGLLRHIEDKQVTISYGEAKKAVRLGDYFWIQPTDGKLVFAADSKMQPVGVINSDDNLVIIKPC